MGGSEEMKDHESMELRARSRAMTAGKVKGVVCGRNEGMAMVLMALRRRERWERLGRVVRGCREERLVKVLESRVRWVR
jgi:hypothetical protein